MGHFRPHERGHMNRLLSYSMGKPRWWWKESCSYGYIIRSIGLRIRYGFPSEYHWGISNHFWPALSTPTVQTIPSRVQRGQGDTSLFHVKWPGGMTTWRHHATEVLAAWDDMSERGIMTPSEPSSCSFECQRWRCMRVARIARMMIWKLYGGGSVCNDSVSRDAYLSNKTS